MQGSAVALPSIALYGETMAMKRFSFVIGVIPLLLLIADISAEERSVRADEEVANRRLALIEQH